MPEGLGRGIAEAQDDGRQETPAMGRGRQKVMRLRRVGPTDDGNP